MATTLKGKVAIVTGASSGIGEVIAKELAKQNATLVLLARRETELQRVLNDIKKDSPKSMYFVTDITDAKNVTQSIAAAYKKLGTLHILVNNAGIASGNPLVPMELKLPNGQRHHYPAMTPEEKMEVWSTNYFGPCNVTRAFNDLARKQSGEGYTIIDILSTAARTMYDGNTDYGGSKIAHRVLSNNVAWEMAQYGVEVRRIHPGNTKTNIVGKDHQWGKNYLKDILACVQGGMQATEVSRLVGDVLAERYGKNKGPYDIEIIPKADGSGKGERIVLPQGGLDVFPTLKK